MSRYIDADALKNKLQQHHDFFVNAWGGFREMPIQDKARCDELSNSIAEIFNAPSIDIVRCKDCKYSQFKDNGVLRPTGYCHRLNVIISGKGKGYCYLAERKDGESE